MTEQAWIFLYLVIGLGIAGYLVHLWINRKK